MRILRTSLLLLLLAAPGALLAQEKNESGGDNREMVYRTINFLLLAGGLGYLAKKNAPAFFAARSESIRKGIADAQKLFQDSSLRAAAVEHKLAELGQEIAALRAKAGEEMAAERVRLEEEAQQAMKRIFANSETEVAAARRAARQELKAFAARIAVDLAAKRIATRITPQTQHGLVGSFVRGLEGPAS